MENHGEVDLKDIERVKDWMYKYSCGFSNARPRKEIIYCLRMEDRYFRQVCSTIPEIITSSHNEKDTDKGQGYYILPLVDVSGEEVRHAREIVYGEERRRMIALYLRQRRQREAIRRLADKETQKTFDFTGVRQ